MSEVCAECGKPATGWTNPTGNNLRHVCDEHNPLCRKLRAACGLDDETETLRDNVAALGEAYTSAEEEVSRLRSAVRVLWQYRDVERMGKQCPAEVMAQVKEIVDALCEGT